MLKRLSTEVMVKDREVIQTFPIAPDAHEQRMRPQSMRRRQNIGKYS